MKSIFISGLKWSAIQQIAFQFINYGTIALLTIWVRPEIHGFFSIVGLSNGLISVIGSLGIKQIIIKNEDKFTDNEYNGLLSTTIIIAIGLFVLSVLLSIIVAYFYKDQFSYQLLVKYGLLLAFISPITVFRDFFEAFELKTLQFRKISIISVVSLLAGVIPSIMLAYFNFEYLSLFFKFFLPHLIFIILFILLFKPKFNFAISNLKFKEFYGFMSYYTLNNISNYFVRNLDYIIIGKFFDPTILGQYSIAYKVLLLPMKNITSRIQLVSFPLLSRENFSSNSFKIKYFKIIFGTALLSFPMVGMIALLSKYLPFYLPEKNYELLPFLIMILSILGGIQSINSPIGNLFIYIGKMKLLFYNSLTISIITAITYMYLATFDSIKIFVVGMSIFWILIAFPISFLKIFKIYGFRIKNLVNSLILPFFSTLSGFTFASILTPVLKLPVLELILSSIIFILFFSISMIIIKSIFPQFYLLKTEK